MERVLLNFHPQKEKIFAVGPKLLLDESKLQTNMMMILQVNFYIVLECIFLRSSETHNNPEIDLYHPRAVKYNTCYNWALWIQ